MITCVQAGVVSCTKKTEKYLLFILDEELETKLDLTKIATMITNLYILHTGAG